MMPISGKSGNTNEYVIDGFDDDTSMFNNGNDMDYEEVQVIDSMQKKFGENTMDKLEHYAHNIKSDKK